MIEIVTEHVLSQFLVAHQQEITAEFKKLYDGDETNYRRARLKACKVVAKRYFTIFDNKLLRKTIRK